MSIILCIISKKGGVVCSDGRKISSVTIKEDGTSDESASIESDDYDKTFVIKQEIIGASCGLLAFQNNSIPEHIAQILGNNFDISFDEIVSLIEMGMKNKLSQIPIDEIRFKSRKIDLLLAGRNSKNIMIVSSLRFYPEHDKILSAKELIISDKGNKYKTFGDDKARKGVVSILNSNKAQNSDIAFLEKLSKNAIRTGINTTGMSPYSKEKACGGRIFSRSI
jgi:hypothetical protein